MYTSILHIAENMDEQIDKAAELLRAGQVVAFPTETVYGLGANALDPEAVARIFRAKGRPADNPLIVHIADPAYAGGIAEVPAPARLLMETLWPGPLTLVMRKKNNIPPVVTAGLSTVAVRMPAHPVALSLIISAGLPVAAPSANRSGRPSPTTADHVAEDMDGRIPLILDGGPCRVGIESTVLDVSESPFTLLRPGDVTVDRLEDILGEPIHIPDAVLAALGEGQTARSPGLKHTHYAPRAPLTVVTGKPVHITAYIQNQIKTYIKGGHILGILAASETADQYQGVRVIPLGSRHVPREMARSLFSALRQMDTWGVDAILAEGIAPRGEGLAFMNRLLRAAGFAAVDADQEAGV
jgi:L-threonylcarbamoyladenylate synthase